MRPLLVVLLASAFASSACTDVHEQEWGPEATAPTDGAEAGAEGSVEAPAPPSGQNTVAAASDAGASDTSVEIALSPAPVVPESWTRVTGAFGISLRAPALVATPAQCGVDSCNAPFRSPDCSYDADRGFGFVGTLMPPLEAPEFSATNVIVDGKSGQLFEETRPGESNYLGDGQYLLALYLVTGRPGALRHASTVIAKCSSLTGLETARTVVQTVMFPADITTSQPLPPPPTTSCTGEDIRPITGYRLGTACAASKVTVPGICALGANTHASSGKGKMSCFVTSGGEYYWAFAKDGEILAGPSTSLADGEELRCQMLVARLGVGEANSVSGELSYSDCL